MIEEDEQVRHEIDAPEFSGRALRNMRSRSLLDKLTPPELFAN